MKQQGIWAVWAIRITACMCWEVNANSKRFTELQKHGGGSLDYLIDNNSRIDVASWINNGMVEVISSFTDTKFGNNTNRWSAKGKAVIDMPCPESIH